MSIAGKRSSLGDEYQLRVALHWLIRLLEDDTIENIQVNSTGISGEDSSVTVDDIVVLYKNGHACFIQAKKNQTDHKAWSFSDKVLKDELCNARDQLESRANSKVKFYSRSPFGDLASLVENCGYFSEYSAFQREADKNQRESLETLAKILGRTEETTYSLVSKISFGSPQGFDDWDRQNLLDLERLIPKANLAKPIIERYLQSHETHLRDTKYIITQPDVLAELARHGLSPTPKGLDPLIQQKGRTPFVTSEDFFRRWLDSDNPFNHHWKLEGRIDYLQSLNKFVQSGQERIAILLGRGGIGKTKLLYAFAENFEHSELILRFVEEGVSVTRENIDNLPARPCVVVLDDAHQREQDVSTLLTLVRQRTDIKLLLSSRPYALNYLQEVLRDAGINSHQIQQLNELRELSREEVKALARQALGSEYAHLADQLASVTKDCPLVTVVGGRLLAEKAIPLGLLERDADFQYDVLKRFQDELVGKVSQRIEPSLCKKLLNLIAAVAPIRLTNEFFKQVTAEFLKIECSELVNYIGILEQSGILLRRGDTLRITPDVLADHILHEACLTYQNESTGYAKEVFEKFRSICLTQLLENLAELDWRIWHTSEHEVNLLNDIWETIKQEFIEAEYLVRYKLLGVLEDLAYYQPKQMLDIVKIAMRPAKKLEDDKLSNFYNYEKLLEKLPNLLEKISYTIDYLSYCCELLWQIVQYGNLEEAAHVKAAIRVLTDLAKYNIVNKPLEYNQKILDFIAKLLNKPAQDKYIHLLLEIITPLLAREYEFTEYDGLTVRIRCYLITREQTKTIRNIVLDLIANSLKSSQIKVILQALNTLRQGLQEPVDNSYNIISEHCEQWESEQVTILKMLGNLVISNLDPLVHLKVIEVISRHAHYSYWEVVRQKARNIINTIPNNYERQLTSVLLYKHDWKWNEEETDNSYEKYDRFVQQIRRDVAEKFLQYYPDASIGVQVLNQKLQKWQQINDSWVQPQPSLLLELLSEINVNYAAAMCEAIVAETNSVLSLYINSLLPNIRAKNLNQAVDIIRQSIDSQNPALCISIAQLYGGNSWLQYTHTDDIDFINKLITHCDYKVKVIAIDSLRKLWQWQPKLAISIALSADISDSIDLAVALFKIFDTNIGISIDELTDENIDLLLSKLEAVTKIDDDLEYVTKFLSSVYKRRRPHSVIQLLLKRIERYEIENNKVYQPLPYGDRFEKKFKYLAASEEYENILRNIRDRSLRNTKIKRTYSYLSRLYILASQGLSTVSLTLLEEWINSENSDKIQATGFLLKKAPEDFLFKNVDFISNLLEQAYRVDDNCYQVVKDSLLDIISLTLRSGTPGQPFPEDVALKEKSEAIAKQFCPGSPSYDFYYFIARGAKERINFWKKKWEEEFDNY